MIKVDAWSEISVPDAWKGWRYPVHYTTLEEMGIDINTITLTAFPEIPPGGKTYDNTEDDELEIRPLSVAEAKAGLAAKFKISPEAIKITIEM